MNTISWTEALTRHEILAGLVGCIWGLIPMMVSLWLFG